MYFVCVGVVYMWDSLCKCHKLGIMYSLAWLFLRMYSRRPRKQDPHDVHQTRNSKHGTATHRRKYGKIQTHCSLLVGRFYNLRPSSISAFPIGINSIILSNTDCLFTKIWANTTWILHVQPSISALESSVPKSWRFSKRHVIGKWRLSTDVLAASNQMQINIYICIDIYDVYYTQYTSTYRPGYMIPNTNLPTAKNFMKTNNNPQSTPPLP